jgi:xylan 1,4-beta-xylosidase
MFACRRNGDGLIFNFQYIDDLFDALLAANVRPFVEFGFFPKDLAAESDVRCFWWQAHVTPPDDFRQWAQLIESVVRHFIQRYGREEVLKWYFEVWNEPNLWFFFNSTKSKYFELYRATALAVKAVDPALKVGGPATSNFVPDDRFKGERQDGGKAITHKLENLGRSNGEGFGSKNSLNSAHAKSCPSISCQRIPIPPTFHSDTTSLRCAPDHQTPP